jgi:CheY-like chemotaxis protein
LRLGNIELRLEMSAPVSAPPKVESPAPSPVKPGEAVKVAIKVPKKFQVLLVDDSMAFLETISELFDVMGNQTWEIHKASAADQALVILLQNPIALVVLDLGMPMLDGVQLLGIIHRRYPEVKKVVLTGKASESQRAACLANGAELFLEKPITPDGIKFVFNVLNDLLSWTHREGFSGTLRQVGLPDVIQMQCLGRNSCILEVRDQQTHGEIYIEDGAIIHAKAGDLTGEKAFHRLLTLANGEFQLHQFKKPSARTVQGPWELLLMESARSHDEEKNAAAGGDTIRITKTPPATKPVPPAENAPVPITAPPSAPLQQSPAPPAPAPEAEFKVLGDDIIVVSTYDEDGKWHTKDEPKK